MKAAFAPLFAFDPAKHGRTTAVWALFTGALLAAVAFVSYVPLGFAGYDDASANLLGPPGRVLGWAVVESFGTGAFGLPFFLVFLGWRLRTKDAISDPLLKVVGLPMLLFSLGLLLETLLPERRLARTQFPLGGVLGERCADLLRSHFGLTWSVVAAGAGLAASIVLTTDTFFIEPFFPSAAKKRVAKSQEVAPKERAEKLPKPVSDEPKKPAPKTRAPREEAPPAEQRRVPHVLEPAQPTTLLAIVSPEDDARLAARKKAAQALEDDSETLETTSDDADDADEVAIGVAAETAPARRRRKAKVVAEAPPEESHEDDAIVVEDSDIADEDDSPPAETELPAIQTELPFKPPKIRDLAAPTRSDAGSVTVINLSRDPKLKGKEKYDLPPLRLLAEVKPAVERETDEELHFKAKALMESLQDFGVTAEVEEVVRGPVITRYDLKMERGTRISRVTLLAEDLAMALGVERVRIAQVKGKSALGVEIPNKYRETVWLREIALAMTEAQQKKVAIPLFLGKDSSGRPIIEDLATMPHLLVAGRTGAGKSVFINSLILSILMTRYPEEVRLIMIDPKKVELEVYQDIPHLLTRVESDPKKAQAILDWAVQQMEERYALLSVTGVRHLRDYNRMDRAKRTELLKKQYSDGEIEKLPDALPYVVIIVDELADLMMASGKAVEQSIARLAQKARAIGIHVVVATQRPSVDVITGLIKANMPSRIAFQTKSGVDSRTILDSMGAEKLLDKGDMLYSSSSTGDAPIRAQGPYVSDDEVHALVDYLREYAAPLYTHHLIQVGAGELNAGGGDASDEDERFAEAVDVVLDSKKASASWLQRHMGLGYARASRMVDRMAELGYVTGPNKGKEREVLISSDQWNELRGRTGAREIEAES